MANLLRLIQDAKMFGHSALLDETDLGTEKDLTLTKAIWTRFINLSQAYHFNLVKQAAQDYFATRATINFVSGTQHYDLPGDSVEIRYIEKIDCDPDEIISPIHFDQRLNYTDERDSTDNDDTLDHFYYLLDRTVGIVPNMDSATGGVSVLYIRRLPDLSYGIVSATPTTTQVRLNATPILGTTSNRDDYYNGSTIEINGIRSKITDYTGSNRACTVLFDVAPETSVKYDIVCDIPEEWHTAVSLYAAVLARGADDEDLGNLGALYQDWERKMNDGLRRISVRGMQVENQDL